MVKEKKQTLLFNLRNDLGERKNLVNEFPEKLKQLEEIFNKEYGSARRDI